MILLVDDDAGLRRVLQIVLSGMGLDVSVASTGEQAIEQIARQQVDAVLLDVNMPGIGGVETCRRLRALAPGLPIVLHTVLDSEQHRQVGFDAGANDYIANPCGVKELVARLKAAIEKANAQAPETGKAIRDP